MLTGETPDSAAIPTGCRFHPRCPLVASGEAERLGVAQQCRSVDPKPLPPAGRHAACHAAALLDVAAPNALSTPQNAPTPSKKEPHETPPQA